LQFGRLIQIYWHLPAGGLHHTPTVPQSLPLLRSDQGKQYIGVILVCVDREKIGGVTVQAHT